MKYKLGIRGSVIILFLGLYLGSLILLNFFFVTKQQETTSAFRQLKLDTALASLSYKTEADSLQARNLLNQFRESLAATQMIQKEAQIYSAVFLFLLMIISVFIFIFIFYIITRPLKVLQLATARIREGDFTVDLPETGIREIRELKQSFNSMSRELDKTQQKLLKAEKEMIWKELSRILAHEIKNPLTPIQLSVQRLEEKFETDTAKFQSIFPEAVSIINQEIDNLQNLARSFSNFARSIEPDFRTFNPTPVLEDIIKSYHHHSRINLNVKQQILIRFDPTHFYQVITNILQNAIDASRPEDVITIEIDATENNSIIRIIDRGSGIAPAEINKIFEPYFTRKKKGTGLGLALVNKLVSVNDAKIQVRSEAGRGSCFELQMDWKDENIDY
ncbi:MAG: HAMP domain-containing protein [Candidatus Cloacimonetes bacterium]|nr:HAMP domain-containing protein [Candidatus Cloacimonadota bacterium]